LSRIRHSGGIHERSEWRWHKSSPPGAHEALWRAGSRGAVVFRRFPALRLTYQDLSSPLKSSPPPSTATSSRRPALTPELPNCVPCCPVAPHRELFQYGSIPTAGMAFERIAATLNSDGIPTRSSGKRCHGFAVNQRGSLPSGYEHTII